MFTSNQEFVVTGSNSDLPALKKTVELLIDGFDFKPRHYYVNNVGQAIFYEYLSDTEKTKVNKSKFMDIDPNDINPEYITQLILLYINSHSYQEALKKVEREDGDGSHRSGWRISIDSYSVFNMIKIEPFMAFYAK